MCTLKLVKPAFSKNVRFCARITVSSNLEWKEEASQDMDQTSIQPLTPRVNSSKICQRYSILLFDSFDLAPAGRFRMKLHCSIKYNKLLWLPQTEFKGSSCFRLQKLQVLILPYSYWQLQPTPCRTTDTTSTVARKAPIALPYQ